MFRSLSLSRYVLSRSFKTKATQQVRYRSIMADSLPQPPSQISPAPVEVLPPLSHADSVAYSRMAETMELYHNSFRQTWKILYGACSSGKRPANMSIRQFLNKGAEFCHHLHIHHSIGRSPVFLTYCSDALLTPRRRGTTYLPGPRHAHACLPPGT